MSSSQPALKEMLESCLSVVDQAALQILGLLNISVVESKGPAWFFQQLEQARANLGSWATVARKLNLNDAEISQFTLLLRHMQQLTPDKHVAHDVSSHQLIAALRFIKELEHLRQKQPALTYSTALPSDASASHQARQQIHTLELMMRQLIKQAWPDPEKLAGHITTLLGANVAKRSQSGSDKSDITSGLLFSELASLLVDKREFSRFYAAIFNASSQGFLVDQRKTMQAFLDEIRIMRNRLVDGSTLTPVEYALLNSYFAELTEPVQKAFMEGRCKVSPAELLHKDDAQLDTFFKKNSGDVFEVKDSLQKVQYHAPDAPKDNIELLQIILWMLVGVTLAGIVVGGIYLINGAGSNNSADSLVRQEKYVGFMQNAPKGDVTGPRLQLSHMGIDWSQENFRSAIQRGDLKVMRLFLEAGMAWQASWAEQALSENRRDELEMLINFRFQMDESEPCRKMISTMSDAMSRGESLTSMRKTFLQTFCSRAVVIERERDAWQQAAQREQTGGGGAVKWSEIHKEIYDAIR